MFHHVELWISLFGTPAVFIVFLTEMLGAPFPAETTLTLLGVEIARGVLHFWPVWLVASLGNIGGSTISYWIGAKWGTQLIFRIQKKFPGVSRKWTETTQRFGKGRYAAIALGKFVSVVRVLVPFLAGSNRFSFLTFTILNSLTTFVWVGIYLAEGRYLAILGLNRWGLNATHRWLMMILLALIALILFRWVLRRLRRSV